jgi:hypothetical protein
MEPTELTIDDLPRFSPWPSRLLGLSAWEPRKKTPAEVTREFGREKWGALLDRYRRTGACATIDVVDGWMIESELPTLRSEGDRFYLLSAKEALDRHYEVVARTIQELLPARAIVELGAGYGSVIFKMANDPRFRGISLLAAEYTDSGVELMKLLSRASDMHLPIGHCDLAADSFTKLSIPEGSIVFTCMAAHYIPKLGDRFVDSFRVLRPKAVVNFEPCYEHCNGETLTGMLRQRYIEMNDYNTNLMTLLHRHAANQTISIRDEQRAVIGVNPLLPISIFHWGFGAP